MKRTWELANGEATRFVFDELEDSHGVRELDRVMKVFLRKLRRREEVPPPQDQLNAELLHTARDHLQKLLDWQTTSFAEGLELARKALEDRYPDDALTDAITSTSNARKHPHFETLDKLIAYVELAARRNSFRKSGGSRAVSASQFDSTSHYDPLVSGEARQELFDSLNAEWLETFLRCLSPKEPISVPVLVSFCQLVGGNVPSHVCKWWEEMLHREVEQTDGEEERPTSHSFSARGGYAKPNTSFRYQMQKLCLPILEWLFEKEARSVDALVEWAFSYDDNSKDYEERLLVAFREALPSYDTHNWDQEFWDEPNVAAVIRLFRGLALLSIRFAFRDDSLSQLRSAKLRCASLLRAAFSAILEKDNQARIWADIETLPPQGEEGAVHLQIDHPLFTQMVVRYRLSASATPAPTTETLPENPAANLLGLDLTVSEFLPRHQEVIA